MEWLGEYDERQDHGRYLAPGGNSDGGDPAELADEAHVAGHAEIRAQREHRQVERYPGRLHAKLHRLDELPRGDSHHGEGNKAQEVGEEHDLRLRGLGAPREQPLLEVGRDGVESHGHYQHHHPDVRALLVLRHGGVGCGEPNEPQAQARCGGVAPHTVALAQHQTAHDHRWDELTRLGHHLEGVRDVGEGGSAKGHRWDNPARETAPHARVSPRGVFGTRRSSAERTSWWGDGQRKQRGMVGSRPGAHARGCPLLTRSGSDKREEAIAGEGSGRHIHPPESDLDEGEQRAAKELEGGHEEREVIPREPVDALLQRIVREEESEDE
mmetsp:Transcript_16992/g.53971  ORF Transcript_16992/g.53971 Transcript_16992/m.53971 type:complete len:326 (+) Transcript_16992:2668-3645(+)